MKYIRHMVVFGLIVILTGMVVILTGTGKNSISGETASKSEPESIIEGRFFRVYFDKIETAHKIVISMNAIESVYEKGYVIVEVTNSDEYDKLIATGLEIEEIANPQVDKIAAIREASLLESTGIPGYPCYRTVEETFATAESIVANHPDLATWTDEGDSWEKENQLGGYDMKVLRLTNSAITGPKPKIFLTAAIHAREYTTAELVTRLAEYLVDNYGTDADATWMLDYHEVHLMLQTNPDGRKKAETGLSWRKNTNENYCTFWPNYRGADLNRNFDFKWNCCGGSSSSQCDATYHGPYAASEPETNAVQDYILAQFIDQRGPNDTDPAPDDATGLYIDVHSHGRLVLWPWGWTPDPSPNATQLQTLGRKFAYFNNHSPEQAYGLYPIDGDTIAFSYGELGIASLAFELGTAFFEDCSYFENTILPGNMPALLYAIKVARTPYMTPAGPDAINLALDSGSTPPGVPSGTIVTLSATINDMRYNNSNGTEPSQNIAAAEYYMDVPPWITDPVPVAIPMSPSDGSFNSTVEAVDAYIDTTGFSEGQHIIFVRGQDADVDNNWGAFSAIFLFIESPSCDDDSDCDDGLYCNGAETCVSGNCQAGSDPCPGQLCDEAGDMCVDCLGNGDCDDGLYCNGTETCVGGVCQPGVAVDCDDSIYCTNDSCNEGTDTCDNIPDDGFCDDSFFCNGAETCDTELGCQAGSDPCPGQYCDESEDICYECETDPECDDGLFCNGAETCVSGTCQAGTPPDCDDGVSCTVDSCNEGTDSCDNIPNDSLCDNGLFCDGDETCDAQLGCQSGTPPDCSDGVSCTDDSCNEATDSCDNIANDSLCDNGLFCDGAETCDTELGCQAGSDPCPGQYCDESE
ncbi:MAG: M14 family metallopeptidase, partial [bacterium]